MSPRPLQIPQSRTPAPRGRRAALCCVLLLGMAAAGRGGEWEWLPEPAEQGLARQLVDGFAKANIATNASDEERMEAARKGIGLIAQRLDAMGVDGLLAAAPSFEPLELPETGSDIVDAIAAYGTCSLPLHFELAADDGERLYVAVGEVAVVVISAFLRHEYLARGGTDADLARLLDTEEFADFSLKVQQEGDLRSRVSSACAGPLGMLMP